MVDNKYDKSCNFELYFRKWLVIFEIFGNNFIQNFYIYGIIAKRAMPSKQNFKYVHNIVTMHGYICDHQSCLYDF